MFLALSYGNSEPRKKLRKTGKEEFQESFRIGNAGSRQNDFEPVSRLERK
jgi:hypothetical protein